VSRLPLPAAAVAAAVALALPAAAQAQQPAPFGHQCTPENGVRVCPTNSLEERVPSWDGTPLDVDVTLPPGGGGPFPTLLLLHGLGGTKTSFLQPSATNPGYDAQSFARAGYAVVTPTARGYGNSCGRPESRTAGCENGFTRLGDMRYEVRDLQTLAGRLVDEGIARPDAIGATGISYGGGMSTMLAFLEDRVRMPDGTLQPWTSPNGTPIRLAAAWPRWLWTNGEGIFIRTGRHTWTRRPVGVPTPSYAAGIFLTAHTGFVAPENAELTANVRLWQAQLQRGTLGPEIQPTLDMAYDLHGVASLSGTRYPTGGPAPLLLQSGWTDALFPVGHSLAAYRAIRRRNPQAPVSLQLADLGHAPAANNVSDNVLFNAQGAAFLDSHLRRVGTGPAPGSVTAITMRCDDDGATFNAPSYDRLTRRVLRFGRRGSVRITQRRASERLAAQLNPLGSTASHCTPRSPDRTNRRNTFAARSRGVTMVGQPVVTGRVRARGRYGQVIARLWDLDPNTGTQLLITRGAYRLERNQRGRFRFTLDGNGWRFARGHRIVVELLGRDEPTYAAAPAPFVARLSRLRIALPVR
jgi:fermentation-respiration switch protein FrsA (DUF1100 family)